MRKLKWLLIFLPAFVSVQPVHAQTLPGFSLQKLIEAKSGTVLLRNETGLVPIPDLVTEKFAALHLNDEAGDATAVFDSIANKYARIESFTVASMTNDSLLNNVHDQLKFATTLFVAVHGKTVPEDKYISFLKQLVQGRKIVLLAFGDDTWAGLFSATELAGWPLIACKSSSPEAASVAAQLIFGGLAIDNKITALSNKRLNKIKTYKVEKIRLGYSIAEAVRIDPLAFRDIDSIVNAGIATHATPGAVVLLVKDGQVIFDKAYGNHTYTGNVQTKVTDIYDMASVTKVTATTPVIMQLYDKKALSLDSPVSKYVHVLKSIPDKRDQTIREALLHEAGYTPYIKFYEKLTPLDLAFARSDSFPTEIAENFFLRKDYFKQVMWPVTLQSPVLTRGKFVYSDVSMYMMKQVAENISHRELDEYVLNEFYLPLGMLSSGFRPLSRFPKSRIVPTTENDNWLRNMQVTGFVNDPGAAMSGGVQGHAGLFSTSNDLAIYYQMLLNNGSYGGRKFFEPATVSLFTSRQSRVSTRGLGFQKPVDSIPSTTGYPSTLSYGHSGYTGTYVWVDPKYSLIYICLTNRVYPDDGKTYGPPKVNIRPQVLDIFYRAVIAGLP